MANRFAEGRAGFVPHGQQRHLEIERHEAFDDDPSRFAARILAGAAPCRGSLVAAAHGGLALAGRAHRRLHDAGQADVRQGIVELAFAACEAIGGSWDAEMFRGKPADALAIHRERRRPGRRHDAPAFRFQREQLVRSNRLDLRYDDRWCLLLDYPPQRCTVTHCHNMRTMRHLHGRRVGIAIDGYRLHAQPLQLDRHFLAELPSAEQQRFRRRGGKRRPNACGRAITLGGRHGYRPEAGPGSAGSCARSDRRSP